MNILDQIIAFKKTEVAARKTAVSVEKLESSQWFDRKCFSFQGALAPIGKVGIIAEFKRKSPSKGVINADASVRQTTSGYAAAGAAALSVLTDTEFFGGSSEDLMAARNVNQCPILRKDFVVEEYQIIEAKSIGADVILLIAAALDPIQTKTLAQFARSLGLEVLLEVHNQEELDRHINAYVNAVGVNNRNLKDFTVNIDLSKKLADQIANEFVKVSESGIADAATIMDLKKDGYTGFLIGETFMKHAQPEKAFAQLMKELELAQEVDSLK